MKVGLFDHHTLSFSPFKFMNSFTDFHDTWYWGYFLKSVNSDMADARMFEVGVAPTPLNVRSWYDA
jgi:hypothetical protein